jgi:hypothetical protein
VCEIVNENHDVFFRHHHILVLDPLM